MQWGNRNLHVALCDRHGGIGADGVLFLEDGNDAVAHVKIAIRTARPQKCAEMASDVWPNTWWIQVKSSVEALSSFKVMRGQKPFRFKGLESKWQWDRGCHKRTPPVKRLGVAITHGSPPIGKDQRRSLGRWTWETPIWCWISRSQPKKCSNGDQPGPPIPTLRQGERGVFRVLASNEIELKVWERGAGATMACGTGACAAALAWWQHRDWRGPVKVNLPGGQLEIGLQRASEGSFDVVMTGPAQHVYSGEVPESWWSTVIDAAK